MLFRVSVVCEKCNYATELCIECNKPEIKSATHFEGECENYKDECKHRLLKIISYREEDDRQFSWDKCLDGEGKLKTI